VTPANAGYYEVAYVAAAVIYVGYSLTIVIRTRALRARLNASRAQTDTRE
jgi:hypothetical protein